MSGALQRPRRVCMPDAPWRHGLALHQEGIGAQGRPIPHVHAIVHECKTSNAAPLTDPNPIRLEDAFFEGVPLNHAPLVQVRVVANLEQLD